MGSRIDFESHVIACTAAYRAPDVFLGNLDFGADLDLWSMGCVAAELFLRRPLFERAGPKCAERSILDAHFAVLGMPSPGTESHNFLKALPFFGKFYGRDGAQLNQLSILPSERLRGCPPHLLDFVNESLHWLPRERWAAASAISHSFLNPPHLIVVVSNDKGKNGQCSVLKGSLEDDVLEYLQQCKTWEKLHEECLRSNFSPNFCLGKKEMELRMKREFVGYIDEKSPPPRCRSLNADTHISQPSSRRGSSISLKRCAVATRSGCISSLRVCGPRFVDKISLQSSWLQMEAHL